MKTEIEKYYKKLEELSHFSENESSIRRAFETLVENVASEQNLSFVAEIPYSKNSRVRPDGTLKNQFRFDFGFWEAKDQKDDLDLEIEKKIKKGYPTSNIIFEDSKRAVLIQNGSTVLDISMEKSENLENLLSEFLNFRNEEILEFEKALSQFTEDVPKLVEVLREKIAKNKTENREFQKKYSEFLEICQNSIDKNISENEIFEMLIQHILTEDIFKTVFDESDFHGSNNIAKKLGELENAIFDRFQKKELFENINYYYSAIRSHSSVLKEQKEKQKFLNILYEEFYKAYNPKRADTLGIVYTPLEIVDFMIKFTDEVLYKNFDKTLASRNVNILDPSTGTGTFMTQIIDYLPKKDLEFKFKNELFANEISILPYYIANLNLEYLYFQKMGKGAEFKNISFVDTLELIQNSAGQLAFDFSEENLERIEKQEESDFTVIIGNPPYNANQQNENDNNKNKSYPHIDKRIKDTFVKKSNAQKTKMYDMYSRFYRWAIDRIGKSGIISFVTNSSFLDSKSLDGFRAEVFENFTDIYVLDLGGNVRKNPKLSGTRNNVFGIQTGVAILILVKRDSRQKCRLKYLNPFDELETKENKLNWLKWNKKDISKLEFDQIIPDKKHNWLNQTENDWEDLIALGTKETKNGKDENAIFRNFSNGVVTNRDEWVYDFSEKTLSWKVRFFIEKYNSLLSLSNSASVSLSDSIRQSLDQRVKPDDDKSVKPNDDNWDTTIKWSRDLKKKFARNLKTEFNKDKIYKSLYRPFVSKHLYFDSMLNDVRGQQPQFFPTSKSENLVIGVSGSSHSKPFQALAFGNVPNLDSLEKTQTFPLHTFSDGKRIENITDFGLQKFRKKYSSLSLSDSIRQSTQNGEDVRVKQDQRVKPDDDKMVKPDNDIIERIDIFHYVYAVLHFPEYRKKYEINLKQDLPRIPFYEDFWKFAEIGQELLDLHINFENVSEFQIDFGEISQTQSKSKKFLDFFPERAFQYKLGNRSAIEWVIDGYKEKKVKDPTIAQMFDNYKFDDYRDEVLSLLKKITNLSLKTLDLIEKLK
ncbi:putative helicase [Thiovulum sp. ES]|nr:putative helicase [Thiovulum sp. ES]